MKLRILSFLLVYAFCLTAVARAQSSTTGQILGTVTDRSGALVPGAQV